MNMSVDSQRNVKTGVSRGNLDRLPFELANLYQRTNVSNVQQQILTLHSLYDLYSAIIDLLYQRRNTVKKKKMMLRIVLKCIYEYIFFFSTNIQAMG